MPINLKSSPPWPLPYMLEWRPFPNRWDGIAFVLLMGAMMLATSGFHQAMEPITLSSIERISLAPSHLPSYALRTTWRMLMAMIASLVFTLTYGTLAAKSRRAEKVLIPILDILQSVPVLGYLSFTATFFLALFPGRAAGAECAAIFAIFTSQAWNMTFSFYQSLRTVPRDLEEVSRSFHLTAWQRFWKLEVPFSMPGLIWNMMMSMSGGWFFIVAAEAITVGNQTVRLPGIGAYLAQAVAQRNLVAVGWVVVTMIGVILTYDQFLFRPLVAWADKFRLEVTSAGEAPDSWVLNIIQRTRLIRRIFVPIEWILKTLARLPVRLPGFLLLSLKRHQKLTANVENFSWISQIRKTLPEHFGKKVGDILWGTVITLMVLYLVVHMFMYTHASVRLSEVSQVGLLSLITSLRVLTLTALASVIWVPVGVFIGVRPKLAGFVQPIAQFLAAFPANLLFPVCVVGIVRFHINPDIWLSLLMILGAQWYILFNIIAGVMAYPNDFKEAAVNFQIRGWQWWRQVMLPGIFPYYVTGAMTASGGAWNASIVSEMASWGNTQVTAKGLGAYIAQMTIAGDYPHIMLGVVVMSMWVMLLNRVVWHPLYQYAENKLRLD